MIRNDRRASVTYAALFGVCQTFERWEIRDDTCQNGAAQDKTFSVIHEDMVHEVCFDHVLVVAQTTL